ncbi:MAG TPA: hypothetical protein VF276_17320, partial [Chloroflexia bacterium]
MTARYSVMVGWASTEMHEIAQTGFYDANASTLQRMARDQETASNVRIIFDFNAPGVPPIREWMQIWAGWRNGNVWLQGPDPPFLGFLVQLEGSGAATHVITAQVQTMAYLTSRRTVIGWPTGESDGLPTAGYPADYSVGNWLVGDTPYPGILRFYFPAILMDGIDPYFDTLTLDATAIPGGNTEALVGQWGFTTVEAVLQDMIGVSRYVAARDDGLLIEPVGWWQTVAQGSILRPRYRLIDANDTASKPVKGVFSVSPAVGEFPFEKFSHTRDGKDVRTDVVVKGIGSDPTTGALIYSRYQGHIADYPCEYLPDGIGGEPYFDTAIDTQAKADAVAATIGYRVWGALGALSWVTDGVAEGGTAITYFEPGDVIALYDPAEGQDYTRYVVRKVTPQGGTAGHPVYRIEVGDVIPNVKELIRGATIVQPHRRAIGTGGGTNTRGAALGTHGLPGAPPQIPMEARPVHSQQNNMRAAFTDVIDLTTDQPTQLRPDVDPDNPPTPAVRQLHRDQYGNPRQWLGPEGADGVHHYTFHVTAAGEYLFTIPDPVTLVEELIQNPDGSVNSDITTSYLANDSAVPVPSGINPLTCT